MSPGKPLVQEVSAHELLRRRLHEDREEDREQRQGPEAVEDQVDVTVYDGDQDAKRVLPASDQHAQKKHLHRVALGLVCECLCHGAVTLGNELVPQVHDPLAYGQDIHDEHVDRTAVSVAEDQRRNDVYKSI